MQRRLRQLGQVGGPRQGEKARVLQCEGLSVTAVLVTRRGQRTLRGLLQLLWAWAWRRARLRLRLGLGLELRLGLGLGLE